MTDNPNAVDSDFAVQVKDIRKTFGSLRAVDGISFDLKRGEFLTIFGPNGAGKTTLIKILSGLTQPTSGSAMIMGSDALIGNPALRREIGVISHASCLYADLTALENLIFYAKMYGLDRPREKAEQAIEDVGLKARMHDRVRTFSRGMEQRLTIARGVIHNPAVLFLDEPFTGLDLHASNVLKEYLHSLHTEKRTILMTTHDISCGLEMGDRVVIQVRGKFVLMEEVRNLSRERFEELYFEAVNTAQSGAGSRTH